ncbi:DUF1566 domain-containing protein [Micavibrio aeruginosavorus]|uniref:DUF1566 domain-containing protein n=1 Tax=Micavibrio aeruginosavorus TaxID=349221 RepID=UPI003F4A9DDB
MQQPSVPRSLSLKRYISSFLVSAALGAAAAGGMSNTALAACASPVGAAGDMMFNASYKVMQYCDNTNWVAIAYGTDTGASVGQPAIIDTDTGIAAPGRMSMAGNFLYVVDEAADTLTVVDISSPANPVMRGSVAVTGATRVVAINNDEAYVTGDPNDTVYVIDVTDPDAPTIATSQTNATTLDRATGIDVVGGQAYVTLQTLDTGVTALNVWNVPPTIGGTAFDANLDYTTDIKIAGDRAYVVTYQGAFGVIDISTPGSPSVMDVLGPDTTYYYGMQTLDVSGDYAYAVARERDRLGIVDLSNDWGVFVTGTLADSTWFDMAQDLDAVGDYVFVTSYNSDSVAVVDVSDKSNPAIAYTLQDATELNGAQDIIVNGSYAYVTSTLAGKLVTLNVGGGGSGGAPSGCSTIGQECSDGSVYAGTSPDGSFPMYTTHCDAGMTWNGSACTGTRSTFAYNNANASGDTVSNASSTVSGSANTASLLITDADSITGGVQPHQAAQYCGDLSANGRGDWYLPALDELAILRDNRVAIGGFELNAGASGEQRRLWSSSDNGQFTAWRQNMPDGVQGNPVKDEINTARCVRKVNPAGGSCTTPAGDEGDIVYNSTHHVMQYCNGTNWVPMGANGNGGAGCSNPTGVAGDMTYNTTHSVMQFCEGDTWVSMGPE